MANIKKIKPRKRLRASERNPYSVIFEDGWWKACEVIWHYNGNQYKEVERFLFETEAENFIQTIINNNKLAEAEGKYDAALQTS